MTIPGFVEAANARSIAANARSSRAAFSDCCAMAVPGEDARIHRRRKRTHRMPTTVHQLGDLGSFGNGRIVGSANRTLLHSTEEVMKYTILTFALTIMISVLPVSGKSNHDGVAFDVASVRLHDPAVSTQGMKLTPNGINYSRVTLHECIMAAYNVFGFQIREAESEMISERYDIVAKTDHQVDKAELMLMLQAFLKERFRLQLHREVKELPVYVLVGGKKRPKLEIVNEAGEGSLRLSGEGAIFKRTSMPRFAEFLSGLGSIQRPVLDQTSLPGVYDFTLSLSDNQPDATKPFDKKALFTWPSIFQDVQDLGLKLESSKAPVDLLIVDHIERPAQN
jgi:uncharacterized protein (TIGR03435 family)